MVVPDDEDSFKIDPEEELDIADDDDGDSDEIDDDYVPEGGPSGSGELDGEGGEIQEEGIGTIQRGVGKLHKKGLGKIQKEGAGARQQEGVGKIHKKGVGKLQKEWQVKSREGVGKVHKKGVGKIQREGAGAIQKEGVGEIPKEGEGSGMGKGMRGSKRKCLATPLPTPTHEKVVPRSPGVCIKAKMPSQTMHHAKGMVERINKKNEVGATIGRCYRCKECTFECATRAACIAHARRKHTDESIGPCDYCGTYYAHSAGSMRHHVNECAGRTTSSDNTDD